MSQKMKLAVKTGLAGAALLLGAALAQAETYDLAGQFSNVNNPNGVWSYGWSANRGSQFNLLANSYDQYVYGGHLIGWEMVDGSYEAARNPVVKALETIYHPTLTVPAGTVSFHPGPIGQNSVIRWTAPASGTYKINGSFTGRDFVGPTTTDVALLRGPVQIFSGFINSYDVPLPFAETMPVLAGETIDFTVGVGQNGTYWCDTTGIDALITKVSDAACTPPPAGMIAWWPGDGSAVDIVGGNNGALTGGANYSAGVAGQAFSFDGASNVSVPDSELFTLGSKPFTIDLWVKFNALQGRDPFIAHDDGGGYYNKWIFWYDAEATNYGHQTDVAGPALRLHVNGDSGNYDPIAYPWNPTPGQWYHVAITRNDATFTLYIDGAPVTTATSPIVIPNPSAPLTIGSAEAYSLNGHIDEVEMFNRALAADEIKAVYLAGSAGKCKATTVAIDIKPGSSPNSINPRNNGVIPVAILTTAVFDAATVDPATVRFGVAGKETAPSHSALEDVNGDGKADLVLQFPTQKTGIACGTTTGLLTGKTRAGVAIQGTDSIVTVGCK